MIVEFYMTKELITISQETKIFDAVDLMKQHDVHRLPVVKNGKLFGLITEGLIQAALPSKATSLSVYEVNYLLNKTTVADVMIPLEKIQTIQAQAPLEEAIAKMRQYNVGVLPVVDEQEHVIGIITNNDIFDAFLEITGYNQDGTRISIDVQEDHAGILAKLSQLFATEGISIIQIVVYRKASHPIIVIQVADPDEKKIKALLQQAGQEVLSCIRTNRTDL